MILKLYYNLIKKRKREDYSSTGSASSISASTVVSTGSASICSAGVSTSGVSATASTSGVSTSGSTLGSLVFLVVAFLVFLSIF